MLWGTCTSFQEAEEVLSAWKAWRQQANSCSKPPSGGTCKNSMVTCACVASVSAGKMQQMQLVGYEGRGGGSQGCCCAQAGHRAARCRAMRIEVFSVDVGGRNPSFKTVFRFGLEFFSLIIGSNNMPKWTIQI